MTFCHSDPFWLIASKLILILFHVNVPKTSTKECSLLLIQHAPLILTWSHKIPTHFLRIVLEHSGFLLDVTFLSHFFFKKISVVSKCCCCFYTTFCSKLFRIGHFEMCAYWRLICKHRHWYLIYVYVVPTHQQVK